MSDDFLYLNVNLNYGQSDKVLDRSAPASKTITRTQSILNNPSDYYGCVSKVFISGFNIPLIIPEIQIGQSNVNLTTYSVQLGFNGTYSAETFVIYKQNDFKQPVPTGNVTLQSSKSKYYFVYTYDAFFDMINYAFVLALADLNAQVATGAVTAPRFIYESQTGLMKLVAPSANYNQPPNTNVEATGQIAVFVNNAMFTFCVGLPTVVLNVNRPCNIMLPIYDTGNSVNGSDYEMYIQNPSELCYFQSMQNIQILTNMPIVSEFIDSSYTQPDSANNQSGVNQILFDLTIDPSIIGSYHTTLVYNKVDNLRMFQFNSQVPLYQVSFSLQFTDAYGRSYPIIVSEGVNCYFKLEFIKKSVYLGIRN